MKHTPPAHAWAYIGNRSGNELNLRRLIFSKPDAGPADTPKPDFWVRAANAEELQRIWTKWGRDGMVQGLTRMKTYLIE